MSQFEKGNSGNPQGRPKGIVDKRRKLGALLENRAEELVKKAVEMAMGGDPTALRLCIERLIPKAEKERTPLLFDENNYDKAPAITHLGNLLLNAIVRGDIDPSDGRTIGSLIDVQRKSIEAGELGARILAIEAALKMRGEHEAK